MAANSAKESLLSLPTTFRPSKWLVSQASSAKGVACEISKQSESRNQCYMAQWAERVDIHACRTLLSGLWEASFWSKNGLRSNLIASKFQTFSWGGSMPPDPPRCCMLMHAPLTWPVQIWWLWPENPVPLTVTSTINWNTSDFDSYKYHWFRYQ